MKKCGSCKFFCGGRCAVLLWANGQRVQIGEVKPDFGCSLWELR